ncbi:KR domain-containing protein [Aspergillus crustosus]
MRPQIEQLTLLKWRDVPCVSVRVHPASSEVNLRADKTYLLVGMTGDLGRSICEWMVGRGARHVVLTSRRPQVDERWISSMSKAGAQVVVLSMDVTNKQSILTVATRICNTLPSLGGLVNGAMIMKDEVFSNLSWAGMQRVFAPKVTGSVLLDEIYHDTPLDFFILFGSLAAPLGNPGQSAYWAGNSFMSAIIARRRARGQVGSIICPGEIQGVGYVARASVTVMQALRRSAGSLSLSEDDVHELFAEAILAGYPGTDSNRPAEIIAGLPHVSPTEYPDIMWLNNPPRMASCQPRQSRFNHRSVLDDSKRGSRPEDSTQLHNHPRRSDIRHRAGIHVQNPPQILNNCW